MEMKSLFFLFLTLTFALNVEGCIFSRALNRRQSVSNGRQNNNNNNNFNRPGNTFSFGDPEDDEPIGGSQLEAGKMGTRLYNNLMRLAGSDLLANTFFALGNYINKADDDFSRMISGEKSFDLSRFSPEQRRKIIAQLKSLRTAVEELNDGFNNILIPNVRKSKSILDIPKAFRDPDFQERRQNLLDNIKKLALLGISPREILPNGLPALFKVLGAFKDDVQDFSLDKLSDLF